MAGYLSIEDMREWNQAPMNPKMLSDNGITFALTTHSLKKARRVFEKIREGL